MQTVKTLKVPLIPTEHLLPVLRSYKKGLNLNLEYLKEHKKTSLGAINKNRQTVRCQTDLSGATSVLCSRTALGIYRSYVRKSKKHDIAFPAVKKLFMPVQLGYNAKLEGERLRITVAPRQYIYLDLQLGEYHREYFRLVEQSLLSFGQIIVTPTHCYFAIKKDFVPFAPRGVLALDINEQQITGLALMENRVEIITWSLKPLYELNCKYFEMYRSLQRRYPNDKSLWKRVGSQWYGNRKNRIDWYVHNILNSIIAFAEKEQLLIVHEQLKHLIAGINKKVMRKNTYTGEQQLHRKLPRKILGRMNRALFNRIQNTLIYKAAWQNIPGTFVSAWKNSKTCPICGETNTSAEWHRFSCSCQIQTTRHLVACVNMLKKHEDERLRLSLDRRTMSTILRASPSVPTL